MALKNTTSQVVGSYDYDSPSENRSAFLRWADAKISEALRTGIVHVGKMDRTPKRDVSDKNRHRPITPEELETMAADYRSGMRFTAIELKYRRYASNVHKLLNKCGLDTSLRPRHYNEKKELIEAIAKGKTLEEMAKLWSLPADKLARHLK